tara:strand:- start:15116 stop:16669 length:1554 start_codon:yes stop_codon:yes gene_type:complete
MGHIVYLGFVEFGVIIAVCLGTATMAGLCILATHRTYRLNRPKPASRGSLRLVKGRVVEGDSSLRNLLRQEAWDNSLPGLHKFFSFRFAGLPLEFLGGDASGSDFDLSFKARKADDSAELRLVRKGNTAFLDLRDPDSVHAMPKHCTKYRAHVQQLTSWAFSNSPHPVWMTDSDGLVCWANRAYRKLETEAGGPRPDGRPVIPDAQSTPSLPDREQRRVRFSTGEDQPDRWFDITEEVNKGVHTFHAIDVTAVVQAESAQQNFVQTLTKTFAQLATGLAIFDRNRRLALFNPALLDLTSLETEYLLGRPGYLSFFDKLRDEKIMPEPRNYASWRDQILDLIAAAEDGRYQETWTLPTDRTYRVTGRPHPNGAVAFLIEDISAEVTLTRRFREQLDLSQAVMESLDDGLAVFSPQGQLSYVNESYRALWGLAQDAPSLDISVSDASRHWQSLCDPDPIWGDFRDFVVGFEERSEWDATVRMSDGRLLDCRFKPLHGGATLAAFRTTPALREVAFQGTA